MKKTLLALLTTIMLFPTLALAEHGKSGKHRQVINRYTAYDIPDMITVAVANNGKCKNKSKQSTCKNRIHDGTEYKEYTQIDIYLDLAPRAKLAGILNAITTGEVNKNHSNPLLFASKYSVAHGTLNKYLVRSKDNWQPLFGYQLIRKTLRDTLAVTEGVSRNTNITEEVAMKMYLGLCFMKGILKKDGAISNSYLYKVSRCWASIDAGWKKRYSFYKNNTSFVSWYSVQKAVKYQLKLIG